MVKPNPPSSPETARFAQRNRELRQQLAGADPERLANNTGALYHPPESSQAGFTLSLWRRELHVSFPDFVARSWPEDQVLPEIQQALLLYYFNTSDGFPVSGEWISFSELPSGRFYAQAFQGYTGQELARHFQDNQEGFMQAAESRGGARQAMGDVSFAFQALPRVPVLVIFWRGDEDFPSSFQVLFDASASHYLPTDAYAILGSTITHELIVSGIKPEDILSDNL